MHKRSNTNLQVPAQKAAIAAAAEHVQIVVKDCHRVDAARVLLQVAHELARSNLPYSQLAIRAATDEEFLRLDRSQERTKQKQARDCIHIADF